MVYKKKSFLFTTVPVYRNLSRERQRNTYYSDGKSQKNVYLLNYFNYYIGLSRGFALLPVKDIFIRSGHVLGESRWSRVLEQSREGVTMDAEKLGYFRTVLNDEMRQLLNEAGKTVSEMTSDTTNFPDPNDRATQESDRSFELRIRDRERKLINKITEALERIDSGEFGACEICGEEIGEARLRARPVTTYCIDCKMEQERQEKRP